MMDDNFDDLLRDAAQTYNQPPEIPREAMWAAIERGRAERAVLPIATARRAPRWLTAAAGVAAVLLVGFAIGRMSRGPVASPATVASATPDAPRAVPLSSSPAPTSVTPESSTREVEATPSARRLASIRESRAAGLRLRTDRANSAEQLGDQASYRMAVVEHLARTEVMLAGFRSQVRSNADARVDAQFASLSRDLLATTRLLLATRRGDDPAITRLLQDLELVLMQLSQYATDGRRSDLDAIEQSMEKHNVMPKLRSTIPAGFSSTSGT
ncbi:MAG: hypothetical protein ABJE47_03550 [bacterium]